jgi:cold shock CspA family protein
MTPGTIESIDHDHERGYIKPDHGGELIPFEFEGLAEGEMPDNLPVGARVYFEVEGGMAGIMAMRVRRVADQAPTKPEEDA